MPSRNQTLRAAVTLLAAFLAGCSGHHPRLARVSGTVTRAGKPVPDLIVTFMPAAGRPSLAATDASGSYTLHYDDAHRGAEFGHHRIFVTFPDDQTVTPATQAKRKVLTGEQQAILDKYGSVQASPLAFDVSKDPQVIDLKLD